MAYLNLSPILPRVGSLYIGEFPGTWAYPTFLAFNIPELWDRDSKYEEQFLREGDLLTFLGEVERPPITPVWFAGGNPLKFFSFRLQRVIYSTRTILTEIKEFQEMP